MKMDRVLKWMNGVIDAINNLFLIVNELAKRTLTAKEYEELISLVKHRPESLKEMEDIHDLQ